MGAQSRWDTGGVDDKNPPQGLLLPPGGFNLFHHRRRQLWIDRTDRRLIDLGLLRRGQRLTVIYPDPPDTGHITSNKNSELCQQEFSKGTNTHPRRGLAGAGPFNNITQISIAVLESPAQIGMTRTGRCYNSRNLVEEWIGRQGHRVRFRRGKGCHHPRPAGPVPIVNAETDRTPHCHSGADPRHNLHLVAFNFHPTAPTMTQLAPGQIPVNCLLRHRNLRGKTFNNRHQGRSVGFTSSQKSHVHPPLLPRAYLFSVKLDRPSCRGLAATCSRACITASKASVRT